MYREKSLTHLFLWSNILSTNFSKLVDIGRKIGRKMPLVASPGALSPPDAQCLRSHPSF